MNCRRCGRPLTRMESVEIEHGKVCLDRLRSAIPPNTRPFQLDKALDLILADGIQYVDKLDCYQVVSSNGEVKYLTAVSGCSCPASGLCYHRVAVCLISA